MALVKRRRGQVMGKVTNSFLLRMFVGSLCLGTKLKTLDSA